MSRRSPRADPEDENERQRQAFLRAQEEHDRAGAEWRRKLGTALYFPMVCTDRRCKRARRCAGDVETCFPTFWPHVPQNIKNELNHAMALIESGMAPREAVLEAHRYVAQRKRIDEELARREAARPAWDAQAEAAHAPVAVTRAQAPARASGPRIRSL